MQEDSSGAAMSVPNTLEEALVLLEIVKAEREIVKAERDMLKQQVVKAERDILKQQVESNLTIGALTSLDISAKQMATRGQGKVLAELLASKSTRGQGKVLAELLASNSTLKELDVSKNCFKAGFAIEISKGVRTNGTLEKLLMAKNEIGTKDAGEALGRALAQNSVLKELDVSNNKYYHDKDWKTDPGFSSGIADGIKNNRALVKLLMGANSFKGIEAGKALGDAMAVNTVLKELDISGGEYGKKCDAAFIKGFSPGLGANGALMSVNLLKNYIGVEQANILVGILKEHPTLMSLCGNKGNEAELNMSGKMEGAEDSIMLVPEIVANGAIEKLLMADNSLCNKEAGKALATMLASNTTLKELDLSNNTYYQCDSPGFVQELAIGVKNNGALTSVNISRNEIESEGWKAFAPVLKNRNLKELNIAGNYLDKTIFDVIRTMEALTSLNVSNNRYLLNRESGKALADVLKDNTVLKELDVSNNYDRYDRRPQDSVGFAQEFAVGLRSNRALTSLNISNNNIGKFVLPTEWRAVPKYDYSSVENKYKHVDGREQEKHPGKPEGFIAIADAIKTNKTLETIRMGRNKINGAEAGKALANVVAINTTLKELDLSSQDTIWNDRRDALDAAFTEKFADGLVTNTALTELNISNNNIASIEAINKMGVPSWSTGDEVEWKGMKGKAVHYSSNPEQCIGFNNTTGVIAFANAIKNNKVLTSLNVSNNRLVERVGTGRFDTYVGETYDDNGEVDGEEEVEYEIMEPDFSKVTNLVHNCGALTILNVSNTNVVQYILPPGWNEHNGGWETSSCTAFIGHDGDVQDEVPEGSTLNAKGAIVLATAMKQNAIEQSHHLVELSLENDPMSRKLRDHTKDLRAFLIATRYFGNDVKLHDVLLKQIAGFL